MSRASSRFVMPAAGTPAAVTVPRRMTVMRSAMASTSSSLWLMKTTELPRAVIVAQRAEELLDLLGCQHGGGLVHDEDRGAAVEHLEDLDALLLAHRELPDHRARVHRQARLAAASALTRAS